LETPEPVAEVAVEPEPVLETPEPVAEVELEPAPEPVLETPEPVAVVEAEPAVAEAPAAVVEQPEPVAQIAPVVEPVDEEHETKAPAASGQDAASFREALDALADIAAQHEEAPADIPIAEDEAVPEELVAHIDEVAVEIRIRDAERAAEEQSIDDAFEEIAAAERALVEEQTPPPPPPAAEPPAPPAKKRLPEPARADVLDSPRRAGFSMPPDPDKRVRIPDPTPAQTGTRTVEYVRSLLAELDIAADPVPSLAPTPGARIVRGRIMRPAPQREIVPAEEPATAGGAFRRRLRRRSPVVAKPAQTGYQPGSIVSRLSVAVWAARDLEQLLDEMPVLAEPRTIARTFLQSVVELFGPETAAVYLVQPDGDFKIVAPHGLSQHEVEMRVPASQSLFADMLSSGHGVFVSPVDLAQGLVAGIPGARTETLMASPLDAGGRCIGFIVIGGDGQLAEPHLTQLCEVAAEAAPGLAFATLIERLRARL
jgi:hypothetical protein